MVDPNAPAPLLGPWKPSELAETASAAFGVGADESLPPEVRFRSSVVKLIRQRLAQPDASSDPLQPAVFLLHPTPPGSLSGKTPRTEPMLDYGRIPVNGRIWFVNAVVARGNYVDHAAIDDDQLFHLVTDTSDLGSVPTVLFEPRSSIPQARFYPKGLNDPDQYDVIALRHAVISLNRVFETIDKVYREFLATPDAQERAGKLWEDRNRWWPKDDAEAIVQLYLRVGLAIDFPTCTVRSEQNMPEGRLDLEIEEIDPLEPGELTRHALLELKVLRSFRCRGGIVSPKYTSDWIESGVKQAVAYRDSRGTKASALCCFDMRKNGNGERCFDHVRDLAAQHSVELKRWLIYTTSEAYRSAIVSNP